MRTHINSPRNNFIDLIAISLSGLCLIHCLALPAIIVALPFLGFLSEEHWVHQLLIAIAAPVSIFALYRTGNLFKPRIFASAISGIILLAFAAFIPSLEEYETILSVLGASLLAIGHIINIRNCAKH